MGKFVVYNKMKQVEDDIKQYLLENISEEKFKELKEEEESEEEMKEEWILITGINQHRARFPASPMHVQTKIKFRKWTKLTN